MLVHGFDGQRLEKYYFIGSVALSLALTIPPYATHQYGWDAAFKDCWYANPDPKAQLAWQVHIFFREVGEHGTKHPSADWHAVDLDPSYRPG